jgi:hypothetical protein
MRHLLLLAGLAALSACNLIRDARDPTIGIQVTDDASSLTSGGPLFQIHYCASQDGPSYLVSELRTDLESQGRWHPGIDFDYQLTTDLNRNHRFDPGDVITVSQGEWSELGQDDVGVTYKVTLYRQPDMAPEEKVGEADWYAR